MGDTIALLNQTEEIIMAQTITFVIIALLVIAGICGWIMNIVIIIHNHATMDLVIGALRIIGIFVPPLGAILGFMN